MKRLGLVLLVVLAMVSPLHHLQPYIENGTAWGAAIGVAWVLVTMWATAKAALADLD